MTLPRYCRLRTHIDRCDASNAVWRAAVPLAGAGKTAMMVLSSLQRSTRMDAVTPQTADTHSHIVRPETMEWQKTRFPGCEAKTLLFDRSTGLMTALMRFAPGAILPDHEHVNIEQTYVLEGSLVDKEGAAEGIEAKDGEFIWGPGCPERKRK